MKHIPEPVMTAVLDILDELMQADNEGSDSPWWMVVDPAQNMSMDPAGTAMRIEGPFFSRQSAEEYLQARRYAYGTRAVVWCASGYWSHKWRTLMREIEKAKEEHA